MDDKQLKRTIEEITSGFTLVEFLNKGTKEHIYFAIDNANTIEFMKQFRKLKGEFLTASVDLLETLSFSIDEKELNDNPLIKAHKDYITKETRLFILLLRNQMESSRIHLTPLGNTKPKDAFFSTMEIVL
jgi:hypothetical protein